MSSFITDNSRISGLMSNLNILDHNNMWSKLRMQKKLVEINTNIGLSVSYEVIVLYHSVLKQSKCACNY